MVSCRHTPSLPATIVSPSRIGRDHKFSDFASVRLLNSNEAWLRSSPRSVPTPMSLSAPIFVEGHFIVTLSSAPPPLSTPIRCLSQCSAFIALQLAIPTQPSTPPRWHRRCLNPLMLMLLMLMLNQLSLPPSRPGRHRLTPAVQLQPIHSKFQARRRLISAYPPVEKALEIFKVCAE